MITLIKTFASHNITAKIQQNYYNWTSYLAVLALTSSCLTIENWYQPILPGWAGQTGL
jgi:hypothetical protein